MDKKEHYNKKGMYAGYDKNHKEREALDYYATPTSEVLNILTELKYDFSNQIILEPCCGGGHMLSGINEYLEREGQNAILIGTDIKERPLGQDVPKKTQSYMQAGDKYDFISDNYINEVQEPDWIIMNPPFSIIEPFVMKSLGLANKGIIMFGRLQFLEGEKRYINILKDCPPSDVYVYVDRVSCMKNGEPVKESSAQAYAWFIWKFDEKVTEPRVHFLRRANKK